MGYRATDALTSMALAIIELRPPFEHISFGGFSKDAEQGNKILNALCSHQTIHETLTSLSLSENPKWWLNDAAGVIKN